MAEPKYQLLDRLRDEEYKSLEADILKRGKIMLPVERDEDGEILDGHHRVEIGDKHGIKYKTIVRKFKTEAEKRDYVFKINLCRRHLSPYRWGQAFKKLLAERGVKRGRGANQGEHSPTLGECAEELGVPPKTAEKRLALADKADAVAGAAAKEPETYGEIAEKMDRTDNPNAAYREMTNAQKAIERKEGSRKPEPGKELDVYGGDFRKLGKGIPDNSVDLIFTDPPYDKKSVPLYGDLGEFAGRVLKDGASLICYLGQYAIPEVCALMAPHLKFFWPLVCMHTGKRSSRMDYWGIVVKHKPMIWFVKGANRRDTNVYVEDVIVSEYDKSHHEWQQGLPEASYLIEQLTISGELVVDPFCGGGTTAVAAARLGRRWWTCDIDKAQANIARDRVKGEMK
jgi:site-specific DNA-methyltransferase (adenine-specific)